MMSEDDYKHFVCIVASDEPDKLMDEYNKNKHKIKKTIYKYRDAESLRQHYLTAYHDMLSTNELSDPEREYIKTSIDEITNMDLDDFYDDITAGYELDDETGDAFFNANPNGKWNSYQLGKIFSLPFLTKSGKEVFQSRKSEIDWSRIHLCGGDIYKRAWEMVVENSQPKTDYEQQIFDNMSDKKQYFLKFETKENYVTSNTAFWGYAFLSDTTGWVDATDCDDQFAWMCNYYDMFIKNLPDDTLLTIFECTK